MANNHSTLYFAVETGLDQCRTYLAYQHNHPKLPSATGVWPPPGPAVTLSAQTGAGAEEIARQLAALLQQSEPKGRAPWTVFDRQLVEEALEEHHLPTSLAKLMPEDRRSYFADLVDEMLGLRPPSWELIPKVIQTVMHLADLGHVILVGRGASCVTGGMSNVFHVRLIASLPKRIERVQTLENVSPKDAARFIAKTDRGRNRYVKAHFHTRVDDNLQYHLILNADRVPSPKAAELIANAARICFEDFDRADETRAMAV